MPLAALFGPYTCVLCVALGAMNHSALAQSSSSQRRDAPREARTERNRDEQRRPLREAESYDGRFVLQVEAGRPGRASTRACTATLVDTDRDRTVWERPLVNDVAPVHAVIRDDGKFVVTLDEYRRGGARNAMVIYGERGELLRHFLLTDLLEKTDWPHVTADRSSVAWLKGAEFDYDDDGTSFTVALSWGREVRIDLRTLRIVRSDPGRRGQRRDAADTQFKDVPPDVLAQIFGEAEAESERRGDGRRQPRRDAVDELSPDDLRDEAIQARERAHQAQADPNSPPEAAAELEQRALVAQQRADKAAQLELFRESPESDADGAESRKRDGHFTPPPPNPAEPVDYVKWLNDLGQVEGPEATPEYKAAVEKFVPFNGDQSAFEAAMRAEPDALNSPEIQSWLASNRDALAHFRSGAQYEQKGWNYQGEGGLLMNVILPDLAPMRQLARAGVVQGKLLEQEGRAGEAVDIYLDALSAGAHTGLGPTLIENLVGTAMQNAAAEALLDLPAGPAGDSIDYADLAQRLESAYRPVRSLGETLEAERAMFLDTAQRLWKSDGEGGFVFDASQMRQLGPVFGDNAPLRDMQLAFELAHTGYDRTLADGNDFYDELTRSIEAPYPEARTRLEELQTAVQSDPGLNPLLRTFAPSFNRVHEMRTRADATRRAALLLANIQAYRQERGAYPETLDAFDGREFSIDPFTGQRFHYQRDGDEFRLYSGGVNGADDGGVHDPSGQTNDFMFWPRPPKK